MESATSQGLDLGSKAPDFKKFKLKNKEVCKAHFQLMDETRKLFNEKQDAKEARKAEAVKAKKEKDDAAAIPDGFVKGVNKKKTFDMDDDQVDVKVESDIDQTIKKVDNKLKNLEKKKKKAEKKEKKEEKAEKDKKELDPKKLKKIQKEKERRKRKREAEEKAEEVKPEKSVVDFTGEDEEEQTAPKPKKNKKKKFVSES